MIASRTHHWVLIETKAAVEAFIMPVERHLVRVHMIRTTKEGSAIGAACAVCVADGVAPITSSGQRADDYNYCK